MSPRLRLYDSEKWMRYNFYHLHKTPEEMAALAKCSRITIYRRLKDMGMIK